MSEIVDIGKERRRIIRREARAVWISKVSVGVRLAWPSTPLGLLIASIYCIAPMGLVIVAIKLAHLVARRLDRGRDP